MTRIYGASGNPATAKLIILADAPTATELAIGRPLVGPAGQILDDSLRRAGIRREDCFILTIFDRIVKKDAKGNVFEKQLPAFELFSLRHGFTGNAQEDIDRLETLVKSCSATTILALGGIALSAIAGKSKSAISRYRGSIYQCTFDKSKKVIGTHHPAAVFRGNFEWRYLVDYDARRAANELQFSGIADLGHKFEMAKPFDQLIHRLKWIKDTQSVVAWDIEVTGRQCAMIGFAWTPTNAVCVNFPTYSARQEAELWVACADIIEDPDIENILQNGMFDVSFLMQNCNVRTRGKVHDTMLKHHMMYHEFPAGLAFMQSLYTDIPYHKDMVKHGEIEKDNG